VTAPSEYQFFVTPYLWLASVHATTMTPLARELEVNSDVSTVHLLSHLDGAPFMGTVEARYGRLGFLADAIHLPVSTNITTHDILFQGGSAALTTGDSSLSSCVEAIIAAQVGDTEKAIRYGIAALLMDLADVGGNVKDGCHIASMGGTWMMLSYGLGGMRDDDGTLSFWPRRAPEDNAILRFPVTYRGQMLEVEIGVEKVEYTLREGESLVTRHENEEIQLTRENPRAVRPVSTGLTGMCGPS